MSRLSSRTVRARFHTLVAIFSVAALIAALTVLAASAASAAANIDQCTNGAVGPPLVLEPCLVGTLNGTSFSNWVNGNSNGQKSHWREGEFISYRVTVKGITGGSHTIVFNYQTVHGSKHALDYVGSFDATETTSPTATQFHRNDNNPCFDILGSGSGTGCTAPGTAPSPASTLPIPAATLTNCAGSAGGPITQIPGLFNAFAPTAASASLTGATYVSQNVLSGTGQCTTTMSLSFHVASPAPSGGWTVVLVWGGHIASQLDWGLGNSASFISGSPFHMALNSLDGASTGSQDRALSTSAVFFTPGITTVIKDSNNNPVTQVPVGTTVHDTAALTGNFPPSAGGTVIYKLFSGTLNCDNTPTRQDTKSVTNAVIQDDDPFTPGSAGSYSYQAVYSGDSSTNTQGATSACEPLTVSPLQPSINTIVKDSSGNTVDNTHPAPLGTAVHDTATFTGGFSPITGTVTYSFFTNNTCAAPAASTQNVTVGAGNSIPPSSDQTLGAGSYSYSAHYGGDSNNGKADSTCEPFMVSQANTSTGTLIHDETSNSDVPPGTVNLGDTVHDTSTVGTQVGTFVISGTVTYHFYTTIDCSGTPSDQQVTIDNSGKVPNSSSHGPLAVGSYSFKADYSGDSNYNSSTSACEPFSISPVNTTTSTLIHDETTNLDVPPGTVSLGDTVHDTSTVGTQKDGFIISGTVIYHLYTTIGCTGPSSDQTVNLNPDGTVPNSSSHGPLNAGSYSFQAVYSGDSNYNGSTSGCEPFTVSPASPGATTAQNLLPNDSATITGGYLPTGTLDFQLFSPSDATCSGAPALEQANVTVNGNGTYNTTNKTFLASDPGTWRWKVIYSGDNNNIGFTIACGVEQFSISNNNPPPPQAPGASPA